MSRARTGFDELDALLAPRGSVAAESTRADLRLLPPAVAAGSAGWVATGWGAPVAAVLVAAAALAALGVVGWIVRAQRAQGPRAARWLSTWWLGADEREPAWCRTFVASVGVSVAVAAAVTTGVAIRHESLARGPLAQAGRAESSVRLGGVLTDDPSPRVVRAGPGKGRPYVLVRMRAETLVSRDWSGRVRAPVLVLTASRSWLGLLPGQRVELVGRLAPARAGDDVAAVVSARVAPRLFGRPSAPQRWAGAARAGLRHSVEGLGTDARGLVPAMVVGDTAGVSPELDEAFRRCGLTHLMAVSGANLAIVGGGVLLLLRALRAPPRVAAAAGLLAVVVFVLLARPGPSVLRAAVMGVTATAALVVGRRRSTPAALCLAVVVLLLGDPWLARSWSFALSVTATAGLLALAPRWTRSLSRHLPRWIAAAIAVPAAAQLACTPLLVLLTGQVSLAAVPTNLLAGPAVVPVTLLGAMALAVAPVSPGAAACVAHAAGIPARYVAAVARLGSAVPGAVVSWKVGGVVIVAAVGAGVLLLALRRQGRGQSARGGRVGC